MGLRITQVDAFTDMPFAGNPAAVCLLPAPRDESWMQRVAREMNLSETAFLEKRDDGFALRWFTPTTEGQFFLQDGKLRYRSSRTTGTAKLSDDKGKTTLSVIADNPDYGKAEYERIRE